VKESSQLFRREGSGEHNFVGERRRGFVGIVNCGQFTKWMIVAKILEGLRLKRGNEFPEENYDSRRRSQRKSLKRKRIGDKLPRRDGVFFFFFFF
jgi:hypothetical protein